MSESRFWPFNSKRVIFFGSGVAALSICAYSAYKYWKQSRESIDEGFEDASRVEERIQVVRVLVIGLDRSGKSTLISQLLNLPVEEDMPTEGSKLSMAEIGQKAYSIWEVGGGEKYRKSWTHFVQDTNLVIFVVDSTDKSRFQLASYELKKILADERLDGVPLIVVANKQDLPGAVEALELFKTLDLSTICSNHLTTCVPMAYDKKSSTPHLYLDRIRFAIKDMVE
ncbi:hypothetical protein ONE63_009309 [Megalurothrips usitatus]|uniref:ADP-ribosylation factor-like protein 3 n=1 Tax=Megalurothrips usitatus TaxID=439358 RepID=A0AAV7XNC1_9NEOP|nr:hypothetical protein ONE63_009309 [Megalurothrips usitatus]